jgi:DNA-binding transcriptional LysR family regulator
VCPSKSAAPEPTNPSKSFAALLFRRRANRLELTDQGRAFQPGLTNAFDAIAKLVEEAVATRTDSVLTVGVAPAFAMRWLIPRLTRFNRGHPEVEVRIATGGAMSPLRDDWTCTVRRGTGDWLGYIADELFPTTLVPICVPATRGALHYPCDLQKTTLIVVSHLREQWVWWCEAVGLAAPIQPAAEVVFESSAMAMQAVLDGVGVAIAQHVSDALAAGQLISPFPITGRKYEGWYLAYRPIPPYRAAIRLKPHFVQPLTDPNRIGQFTAISALLSTSKFVWFCPTCPF